MNKIVKKRNRGKLERKILLRLCMIFFLVMLITSASIILVHFEKTVEDKREELEMKTEIAALSIPSFLSKTEKDSDDISIDEIMELASTRGEVIDGWFENGTDEWYDKCCEELREDMPNYELDDLFAYKVLRDENGELINEMEIILDVPASGHSNYSFGDHFGPSVAFETIKHVYETGKTETYNQSAYNESGFVLVTYAPIKYHDGTVCAVMGSEIKLSRILMTVLYENELLLIVAAVNCLILGTVIFIFIKKSIVKPVSILSNHIENFVSDNNDLYFKPVTEIHTNDEIERIADDFNDLAQRIIDYTKKMTEKSAEEERLKLDLDVARQIRTTVSSEVRYPAFPERTDFDLCVSLKHTILNKCSYCNYFLVDANKLFIIFGDSHGSSLASMIMSIISVAYIKSFAKMGFEPQKIAFEANNQLCSIEKKDQGLTTGAIIAEIDLKNGIMKYVNAGMPPILIKKAGEGFAAEKANLSFSLGQMRGITFEQNTVRLWQGNTILFTSYGVSEMINPSGEKYTIERLQKNVTNISSNLCELNKMIERLEENLDNFRQDAPILMDTAILGFRYFG